MAILSVIKSEAPNGILVWKHPTEDFSTSSTLIVQESQVALFYKNGQIADVFEPGRYVLSTQNIPILRKLLELPTGGVSTFSCKVYFVNMVEAMDIKWGLNSRITYMEPQYGIPVKLGARGAMSICVDDPKRLVVGLVGAEPTLTAEALVRYFRSQLVMRVKSHLARSIKAQELSVFELDSQLDVLAEELKARIAPDLVPYGFRLRQFTVDEVLLPEDDPAFLRVKRMLSERQTGLEEARIRGEQAVIAANASANVEVIQATGHAQALQVQGTSYREERQLDIAEAMAQNPGMTQFSGLAGSFAMMGGAIAMGTSAAQGVADAMTPLGTTPVMRDFTTPTAAVAATPVAPAADAGTAGGAPTYTCRSCGAPLAAGSKFCNECGAPQTKYCPNCGTELSASSKFCNECGTKL